MTRPDGPRVLVTRPAERAGDLVNAIADIGGEAVVFPVLEISLAPSPAMLLPDGNPLAENALLVFVSVYSVRALEAVLASGLALPRSATLAAIGPATAAALAALGLSPSISPQGGEDSEGLLRVLDRLELTGRQVVIYRGQSGRELLSRELQKRGARVIQVPCYRRERVPAHPLADFRRWLSFPDGVVTITSVAILEALVAAVPDTDRARLMTRSVVALSDRIGSACRQAGFSGLLEVARGTSVEKVVEAIQLVRHDTDPG